uniref:Uncharacterized protein n=1 Tax=Helianthus annuus TaxID=4232 RepID=A0A251TGW7_HELAN
MDNKVSSILNNFSQLWTLLRQNTTQINPVYELNGSKENLSRQRNIKLNITNIPL